MTDLPARLLLQQSLCTAAEQADRPMPMNACGKTPRERPDRESVFEPGLRVRVILAEGRECAGLVRWDREDGECLLQPYPPRAGARHSIERLS